MKHVVSKKERWTSLFRHTGLGIGYLFCFFSPGNFYRSNQSHDVVTSSYFERLKGSCIIHFRALTGNTASKWIFIISLLAAYTLLIILLTNKENKKIMQFLFEHIDLMVSGLCSVFIWAMTPKCPQYGMDWWILTVYIVIFGMGSKLEKYFQVKQAVKIICPLVIIIAFTFGNIREIYSYEKVSYERRQLVEIALDNHESEVIVPKFDESLSVDRYEISGLNDQTQYDSEYFQKYYGTHLVIEQ